MAQKPALMKFIPDNISMTDVFSATLKERNRVYGDDVLQPIREYAFLQSTDMTLFDAIRPGSREVLKRQNEVNQQRLDAINRAAEVQEKNSVFGLLRR